MQKNSAKNSVIKIFKCVKEAKKNFSDSLLKIHANRNKI